MSKQTVAMWGNSLAVRIPKNIAVDLNLQPGTPVDFQQVGNTVLISHKKKNPYTLIPLEKLLKGMKKQKEFWPNDTPRGKEIW